MTMIFSAAEQFKNETIHYPIQTSKFSNYVHFLPNFYTKICMQYKVYLKKTTTKYGIKQHS